jgi:hypothetical protein
MKMQPILLNECHNLYVAAESLVQKGADAFGDNIFQISDEKEREFLLVINDFFLQKRQKQVINEGLF